MKPKTEVDHCPVCAKSVRHGGLERHLLKHIRELQAQVERMKQLRPITIQ